jgi:hypothetical protein
MSDKSNTDYLCYRCHRPTDVDGTGTDWCMAERILRGVKDIVPVHRDCIDVHDRVSESYAIANQATASRA